MAQTKASDLKDLQQVLAELRALPGLKEKSPGIFYFKSISFLHFHGKDGRRWAEVKLGANKRQNLEIDFGTSAASRAMFLKSARAAHEKISNPKAKARK